MATIIVSSRCWELRTFNNVTCDWGGCRKIFLRIRPQKSHFINFLNLLFCLIRKRVKTRSSPQWWSGRSTTSHGVFNLWSLIYVPSVWVQCIPINSLLTNMVDLLPFLSYSAGSKSVSVCPSDRPGNDDKYRSRSYRFVEREKGRIESWGKWVWSTFCK